MTYYLYLHGFASSPQSVKARQLTQRFRTIGVSLIVPDLNQDDFYHLMLTRQIQQVRSLLPAEPATLIGCSFGGLTAAWLAEACSQVHWLILLAPAFGFLDHGLPRLGTAQTRHWQETQAIKVYSSKRSD